MLRNKLMTACSVALLTAALYGCSSSSDDGANMKVQDLQDQIAALSAELGEGEELTPEALAALIQAKVDAEAALADAMIAHQAALDQAAMDAETAKTAALDQAAVEAMTAQEAALDQAAMDAETAKTAALAAAAMEAMTAHEAALAAAAMEAMTAHEAALAAAAMEAMTAHEAALAAAAETAAAEKQAALDAAAIAAADMAAADKAAALEAAATAADAAQAMALADAKTAADAAQAMALADAKTAADAAQAMALADAKTAADAAHAMALADAKTAADAAQAMALADAKTAADAAQAMALADAKTAADAAQATALADAKVEADAALKVVQDELDAANIRIADIEEQAADLLAANAVKERKAREAGVRMAIGNSRVGGTAKAFPTGITEQAVTRDAADKITVDVNGAIADAYVGGEATAGSGAWNKVTLTKTDAVTEAMDTVVFYTDIAAPSDKKFTDQYMQTVLDDALLTATVSKVMSAGFPSEPGTTWTYTGADDGRAKTVTGTFDGVPGDFTCGTTTCEVEADEDGKLVGVAGWRFTADSQNTATVKDPDVAYAYFGWWLNKPEDNTATHMTEVFAGGTMDHEAAVDQEIVGNATYSGPAAGKYVTKTLSAGVHSDSGVGHFTATASLTAKFGGDTTGGTIGGSVTGFVLDDVTAAPWKVILEDAMLSDGDATFNGFSEVDFGGGATATDAGGAGTWQGSFYDDADATDNTNAPGTVAGTFDAVTESAAVIGGFGATKQ